MTHKEFSVRALQKGCRRTKEKPVRRRFILCEITSETEAGITTVTERRVCDAADGHLP